VHNNKKQEETEEIGRVSRQLAQLDLSVFSPTVVPLRSFLDEWAKVITSPDHSGYTNPEIFVRSAQDVLRSGYLVRGFTEEECLAVWVLVPTIAQRIGGNKQFVRWVRHAMRRWPFREETSFKISG